MLFLKYWIISFPFKYCYKKKGVFTINIDNKIEHFLRGKHWIHLTKLKYKPDFPKFNKKIINKLFETQYAAFVIAKKINFFFLILKRKKVKCRPFWNHFNFKVMKMLIIIQPSTLLYEEHYHCSGHKGSSAYLPPTKTAILPCFSKNCDISFIKCPLMW